VPARESQPFDGARHGSRDRGLHLHRLDRGDRVAGLDAVALGDRSVTTPSNGAGTWPGFEVSAFSCAATSAATDSSRTLTGRSWPLIVHITVR
jgi:hypothetical protein